MMSTASLSLTTLWATVRLALGNGRVAQLVERGIENPCVGGSTPSLATPILLSVLLAVAACGDKCEVLCQNAGASLAECKPASVSWPDVGARNRNDFVNQCRQQWDRERIDLTQSDLRVALDICNDTSRDLSSLTCEEITALYAPID